MSPWRSTARAAFARLRRSAAGANVALMAILLVSFILCNYTNMTGSNWVIHPDDHEAYVLGRNLKETGSLSLAEPLNELFEDPVFTPAGAVSYRDRVVPTRALGIYFLAAAGFFLGDHGPFYILPLFGVIALIFLFKIAKLMTDEKKALLATFLVAMSAPFLYWNGMLYANVPALAFLLGGMYFLLKIAYAEEKGVRDYLLTAAFFALAVWMRYEVLLVIALLLPIVVGRRKSFRAAPLLVAALLLVVMLAPIALLNQSLYGNPFGVGYAKSASAQAQDEAEAAKGDISSIYSKFIQNYFRPDIGRVYENGYAYLFQPFPILLLAGLLGLASSLGDKSRKRWFAMAMLLIAVVWTYYVLNAGLWSGSSGSLTSSYFRYLLIVYAILALFAPVFLERFRAVGPAAYKTVVLFFIISFMVMQLTMLAMGPFGLKDTIKVKEDFKRVEDYFASQTPENSVVVASLYAKAITCRPVLRPDITRSAGLTPAVNEIEQLLKKGYEVYLMEASRHAPTFLDLSSFIAERRKDLRTQTVAILPISGGEKVEKVVLADEQ